jgi:hypothetical protein
MKLHRNAKLSVKGRELLVERIEDATAPRASGWPGTGARGHSGCWIAPLPRHEWPIAPTSGASR